MTRLVSKATSIHEGGHTKIPEVLQGEVRIGRELNHCQQILKDWFYTCYFLGTLLLFGAQVGLWIILQYYWGENRDEFEPYFDPSCDFEGNQNDDFESISISDGGNSRSQHASTASSVRRREDDNRRNRSFDEDSENWEECAAASHEEGLGLGVGFSPRVNVAIQTMGSQEQESMMRFRRFDSSNRQTVQAGSFVHSSGQAGASPVDRTMQGIHCLQPPPSNVIAMSRDSAGFGESHESSKHSLVAGHCTEREQNEVDRKGKQMSTGEDETGFYDYFEASNAIASGPGRHCIVEDNGALSEEGIERAQNLDYAPNLRNSPGGSSDSLSTPLPPSPKTTQDCQCEQNDLEAAKPQDCVQKVTTAKSIASDSQTSTSDLISTTPSLDCCHSGSTAGLQAVPIVDAAERVEQEWDEVELGSKNAIFDMPEAQVLDSFLHDLINPFVR